MRHILLAILLLHIATQDKEGPLMHESIHLLPTIP